MRAESMTSCGMVRVGRARAGHVIATATASPAAMTIRPSTSGPPRRLVECIDNGSVDLGADDVEAFDRSRRGAGPRGSRDAVAEHDNRAHAIAAQQFETGRVGERVR